MNRSAFKPHLAEMQGFMAEAINEAKKALEEGEFPVGALIVKDEEIIARDHNRKEQRNDPTAHAEILVIRKAAFLLKDWRLKDCALYVTAEPCPMCMGAVIQTRLSRLIYGAAEKRFGAVETTAQLAHHPMLSNHIEIYPGILESECEAVMRQCFCRPAQESQRR